MSFNRKGLCNTKIAPGFADLGAVLWIRVWPAPYLFVFNDLVQWR